MNNKFYITTPIYYTNGVPHIGHAYSSIIANILFKYNKINGLDVKFSTGVDENSQKAVLKAEELKMDTMSYLDMMSEKHKSIWDGLNIEYTDFIRTTEKRHHNFVREVLQKSFDNGDIYEGEYEGLYCVGCEAFMKKEDLDSKGFCPDHKTKPDIIKEKNYFFALSKYEQKLKDFYINNPDFVIPNDRFNEVKAFVNRGLDDFSISRETNKFGIKLPFDESQVTYVWYDALFNYLTVCQGGDEDFWPASLHIVGKDIIRFHAIYWPAMLLSAGYELPKQILTTGFMTIDGHKISKSLGNVIDPVDYCKDFSKEMLILYLLSSFNIGQDGDFDKKQAILTYNAKLANNFGNLVNRVVVLTLKLSLENGLKSELDEQIESKIQEYIISFDKSMKEYNLKKSLDNTFVFLDEINKYVDDTKPWTLIKDKTKIEEVTIIFYTIAESLRIVGLNLYVFFPEKMLELFQKIGLSGYGDLIENGDLTVLRKKQEVFMMKEKGEALFDRFDLK